MRPGYDRFIPDYGSQNPDSRRRNSMRGDRENAFDWRRDDRDGRRDGPVDKDAAQAESERALPPSHRGDFKGQQKRGRSNSVAGARYESHNTTVRSNTSTHQSAVTQQTSPIISSINTPIPSHPRSDRPHASMKAMTAPSHSESLESQRTADPRPHALSRSNTPYQNAVASPASSSADEGPSSKGYGWLTKELTGIVASRIEVKREFSKLQSQLKKYREDLILANKMFSGPNPYIEKLNEDIQYTEKANEIKKTELDVLTKKEESAIRALTAQNKKSERLKSEVAALRKSLEEEQNRTKSLRTANDGLQQQIDELKIQTNELSAQVKSPNLESQASLQAQIDDLRALLSTRNNDAESTRMHKERGGEDSVDMNIDTKKSQESDLEATIRQVKSHQVEIAHLNNVLITQGSLTDLTNKLNRLDEELLSGSLVTTKKLEGYVQYFNSFEERIEGRIQSVENSRSYETQNSEPPVEVTNLTEYAKVGDLDQYAKTEELVQYAKAEDLAQYVQTGDLAQFVKAGDLSQFVKVDGLVQFARLSHLDQYVKTDDLAAMRAQLSQLEAEVHTNTHTMNGLQERSHRRIEALERSQQNTQQIPQPDAHSIGFPRTEGRQLQVNLADLQATVGRLTETCNGNAHALVGLNQRFNNITTHDLAQRMAGMIGPMLAPQVTRLQGQLQQMQNQQTSVSNRITAIEVQAQQTEIQQRAVIDRVTATELQTQKTDIRQNGLLTRIQDFDNKIPRLENLQGNIDRADKKMSNLESSILRIDEVFSEISGRLDKTEGDLLKSGKDSQVDQRFAKDIEAIREAIAALQDQSSKYIVSFNEQMQDKWVSLQKTVDTKILEDLASTKVNYDETIQRTRLEQEEKFAELVDQVKEARDTITARLIVMESEIANLRQNGAAASYTRKTETAEKMGTTRNDGIAKNLLVSRGESSTAPRSANGVIESKHSVPQSITASKAQVRKELYTDDIAMAIGKHFPPSSRNAVEDTIVVSSMIKPIEINDSDEDGMDTRGDQISDSESNPSLPADDPTSDYWQKPGESSKTGRSSKSGRGDNSTRYKPSPARTGNSATVKRRRELSESTPKSSQASNTSRPSTPRSGSRNRKKSKH